MTTYYWGFQGEVGVVKTDGTGKTVLFGVGTCSTPGGGATNVNDLTMDTTKCICNAGLIVIYIIVGLCTRQRAY